MSRVNGTIRWPLSAATTTVTGWEDRSLVSTSGNKNWAQPSRNVMIAAAAMTPRQTLTMVACSVAVTGLAAGINAVPAGVVLHHSLAPASWAARSRTAAALRTE